MLQILNIGILCIVNVSSYWKKSGCVMCSTRGLHEFTDSDAMNIISYAVLTIVEPNICANHHYYKASAIIILIDSKHSIIKTAQNTILTIFQ